MARGNKRSSKGKGGGDKGKTHMQRLLDWEYRHEVDLRLDSGETPYAVQKWMIEEMEFDMITAVIYKYAKKRKEALMQEINVDQLLDTRREKRLTEGDKEKEKKDKAQEKRAEKSSAKRLRHDMEMLDVIMDKGFQTLQKMEAIPPQLALQAMKLKNDITGGEHNGMTLYGMDEIRLQEAAREKAVLSVLMEYVPEDKRNEAMDKMEEATAEYYRSIGMGAAYEEMKMREGAE